jgi:hypothetical protein
MNTTATTVSSRKKQRNMAVDTDVWKAEMVFFLYVVGKNYWF